MIWIEPGAFLMGASEDELNTIQSPKAGGPLPFFQDSAAELAQHPVNIRSGFWMGQHEVTIGHYVHFLNSRNEIEPGWQDLADSLFNPVEHTDGSFRMRSGRGPTWGDLRQPMTNVHWKGAIAYCEWLNENRPANIPSDYRFTLPTEEQWEYACRAGTETMTHAGDLNFIDDSHVPELDLIAWYIGNSGIEYLEGLDSSRWTGKHYNHQRAGSHPVGLKAPNAWGLHDMLGNVWEWCLGTGSMGGVTGRMVRGGAWNSPGRSCWAAFRSHPQTETKTGYGFRVVLSKAE